MNKEEIKKQIANYFKGKEITLQTLKDIEKDFKHNNWEDYANSKMLKAEAIKWLNYMDNGYGCWIGRSLWMKRFNITEKELNNEGKG